jgi:hypothetical protein
MGHPVLALTVVAVSLGLLVGLLRGGSLGRLAYLPLRLPWLAGIAWLVQVALFISPLAPTLERWAAALHLASVGFVGAVVLANRAVPGVALFGVGLLLNAAVYAANGGFMPVSDRALLTVGSQATLEAMRSGARVQKTFLMRPDTPLWFLGDVLPVPLVGKVYSPGDVVAATGAFLLVAGGMGSRRQARYPGSSAFVMLL